MKNKSILALTLVMVFISFTLSGCCKLSDHGTNTTNGTDNATQPDNYSSESDMSVYQSGNIFSIVMDQTGETIIKLSDTNSDGNFDYISMDTNEDEIADAFLFDRDYDGKVDKWHVILNGVDSYAWDLDADGVPDIYDSDGDGTLDAWDLNGDGLIDQRDPDNDGVVELHDSDFDGVFDEIEALANQ
jgi:hypothetical protein